MALPSRVREPGDLHDKRPATPAQKRDGSIWDVHFGLPGLDTTLPMLLDAAARGVLALGEVVRVYSEAPARWYGLHPRKDSLAPGADADVALASLDGPVRELRDGDVLSKAGWTPYAGREVRGEVVGSWLRGTEVARHGTPVNGEQAHRPVPPRTGARRRWILRRRPGLASPAAKSS